MRDLVDRLTREFKTFVDQRDDLGDRRFVEARGRRRGCPHLELGLAAEQHGDPQAAQLEQHRVDEHQRQGSVGLVADLDARGDAPVARGGSRLAAGSDEGRLVGHDMIGGERDQHRIAVALHAERGARDDRRTGIAAHRLEQDIGFDADLRELRLQEEETLPGYKISRLEHGLQAATRALDEGADTD